MSPDDDLKSEYDFSSGVQGKYAQRYRSGTNLVLIDPELAKQFPSEKAVNEALRELLQRRGTQSPSRAG